MADAPFADRLIAAIQAKKTPLIVGLDPVYESLPPIFLKSQSGNKPPSSIECIDAILEFSHGIIRTVAPHVPAIKINIAYFERYYWNGVKAYFSLIKEAAAHGLLVIGDVKRADIGHTSEQYARGNLGNPSFTDLEGVIGPDAVTVNPYFGIDGVAPFLQIAKNQNKGIFVLLRTSNTSAGQVQEIPTAGGRPLFMHVAALIDSWGNDFIGKRGFSSVGAVVGATSGEAIAQIRSALPHALFLIPGFGTQGGSLQDCARAFNADGLGAVISASRSIIFAHQDKQFAHLSPDQWTQAVQQAVIQSKAQIAQVLPNRF
ncbi:MAG TPA: orotidine-5'-phosphate decarboxylase [Phycisphaerae bacterium]|nr:orotidine-5'-phosphate decarboxylase [Phycisphaerae bacterium]